MKMNDYNTDLFTDELAKLGITLSDFQLKQFLTYYELLIEKNKVMNLTTITEYEEVIEKHFLDSISLCKVYDLSKSVKVLDMGTGAGFPGIPLKIAFPEIEITLADSLNKRIKFLNEVIEKLELSCIETIHGRAEDFAKQNTYREQYDLCVSRAVANLSTLSEYCLPYVKVGGCFIPYKSGDVDQEIVDSKNAISILGGKVKEIYKFELPETDIKRSLIVINKIKTTAKKYPRKAGMPSKEPLK